VGASVIAVAPIAPTPTEIQIPNPVTVVDRGVQLTANEIENAFNQLTFVGAQLVTTLAKLPAPVVAQILGIPQPEAQALLALSSLGLVGSVLSTTGATGTALQNIVDALGSFDLVGLVNALIGAPATLIDGLVNGGYGADLTSLVAGLLSSAREAVLPPILPGGLIKGSFPFSLALDPARLVLVGLFPTLQFLVSQIADRLPFGGAATMAAPLAALAPVQSEGAIEGAVNALVFNLVARPIVAVAGILGSVLAPVLGEELAAGLPIAALGLFGPLISGPGAIGTAIQDVVDSLGSGDIAGLVNNLIGAPATIIDGVVNGGYGPNLQPLLPDLPTVLPPGIPITSVLAGGLIPNPGFLYPALLQGLGLKVGATGGTLLLPGVFPTVQKFVDQILGALPGVGALSAAKTVAPLSINSVDTDTSDKKLVTLDVAPDSVDDSQGKHAADLTGGPTDEKVPPKVDEIKAAIDSTPPGPDLGKKVSDAAKPDAAPVKPGTDTDTDTDTLDMTDGGKVIPDTPASDNNGNGKKKGGSNPVGAAISSVAKGFAGAVKSALGG
jgi:hypothetical protein